ncbi:MAG: insulinase family protein [Candidatus Omnitrophica bacterium]|nr:insulinase family protein [Candidatus Omnitrophota bacterium]MBI3083382.1 insulinase family protein [Candidatus Omnitrophota bacterium]
MSVGEASEERMVESRSSVGQQVFKNGLQLVWEEDHRQPLVAIEARIKGGLRGEGRAVGTGITHFIEHMLFKGTPSRPTGSIEREVRGYGGTINAFTSFDSTGVSLFVERRYLKEGLGLLADILQHAVFDQGGFDKERAVIVSEIQMNLDDPDRRLSQLFWSRHFLEHPYRHPILGYQPLLERLTVSDLAAFYASQYQPQNVTIACVGDLEGAALPALVNEVLGSWPRGMTDPSQQLVPAEPPAVSRKDASLELPVQTAYVMLGFSSTRLADPALYPLDVLANILGEGRSSRLYETVVRKRQLAHAIAAWNYTPYDPGVFAIQLQTDAGNVEAATHAVLEILDDVKQHGVVDAELRKAKRAVRSSYLFSLQTVEARAADVASSMAATGDPLFSRRYVSGIEGVTRQQVQEAAQRFCDPSKMTTAVIRPAASTPSVENTSPPPERIPVTKTIFENGATALLGVDHALPIAAIVAAFRGGVRAETEEDQGVSNLVAQLLTKGTRRKSALDIAQQVESLGGTLEAFSGRDGFGLVLQLLSQDLEEGLSLMHELVTQSAFPEEEVAIQRRLIAKQLQTQDDEIFDVGGRLLRQQLFSHHPYRFDPLGKRETIGTLTRAACLRFAQRWMVPENSVLAVFGDVDQGAVARQLQRSFGSLATRPSAWPAQLPEEAIDGIREVTHTMDKEQALIMLGFLGSRHTAPDRYALDVMTAILSGMAGRLFQAVREERGLSYTLGAVNVPGWDPGYLLVYAATRPTEQSSVLNALDEQLRLAVGQGFSDEEVFQAKRYLIGLHRAELQHLVGLARRSALDELYGLGFDAWTQYEDRINALTTAMVNEAAGRYLTMRQRVQVVISPDGQSR